MRLVQFALVLAATGAAGAQEPPRVTTPRPSRPPAGATLPTPALAPLFDLDLARIEGSHLLSYQLDLARLDLTQQLDAARLEARTLFADPALGAVGALGASTEWRGPMSLSIAGGWSPGPQRAWASGDPADSLYREAREFLNRGEWRKAVTTFGAVLSKYPSSAYAPDAQYWMAFALYRIGGTEELRTAAGILETQRARYPNARSQSDASALAMRIRGALAARGDAVAARELRGSAGDSALRCDQEEQSVRAEALSAVAQSDPDGILPMLQRVLQRKDECSVVLRRAAVFLVGSKRRDAPAITLLTQVAKTDPSFEVRESAIGWLARTSSEDAVAVLEEIVRDGSDERMQRAAARALVAQPSARARVAVRALVERSDVPERIRLDAIGAFDKESTTPEDAAWLRSVFAKSADNARIRTRVVGVISRLGGTDNDQWLLTVARNPDEDSETRGYALQKVALSLPVADLAKLYDASAERRLREALIDVLSRRAEPEATDKLIDILKTGTDPNLRRQAIAGLTRKKDPRSTRLLMEIIEK